MKVKICGVTHPEDAAYAAQQGADYIGINFFRHSKRYVTLAQAQKISIASKTNGAVPVGIFVDETLEEILSFCQAADIQIVQLHGEKVKSLLPLLIPQFTIYYAVPVALDGSVSLVSLPQNVYPLYDTQNGGTGLCFDWKNFIPPKNKQWILAGGLNPLNIAQAIHLLKPTVVDVASGVEQKGSTRKDPSLVAAFINAAKMRTL